MPLSEHEEQILAEIERQLVDDDPRFAARTQRMVDGGGLVRRRWIAVALFVVGLAVTAGLAVHIVFGFVGFAAMFAGIVLGASTFTGTSTPVDQRSSSDH